MSEIKINIDDRDLQAFVAFLETLNYLKVEKVIQSKGSSSMDPNSAFLSSLPPDSPLRQAVKSIRKNVTTDDLIRESGDLKTDLGALRQLAIALDIPQSSEELLAQLSS